MKIAALPAQQRFVGDLLGQRVSESKFLFSATTYFADQLSPFQAGQVTCQVVVSLRDCLKHAEAKGASNDSGYLQCVP